MGTHPIFESDFDCLTEMLTWTQLVELYLLTDQTGQVDQRLKAQIDDLFKIERLTEDLLVSDGDTPDVLLIRVMSSLCALRRGIHEQASSQGLFDGDDESEYVPLPKGQKAIVLPKLAHSNSGQESDRLDAESVDSFVPDITDDKRVSALSLLKMKKKLAEWKNGENGESGGVTNATPNLTKIKSKLAQAELAASVASSKESAMEKRMAKVFGSQGPQLPAPIVTKRSAPTIPVGSSSSEDEDFNVTIEKATQSMYGEDEDSEESLKIAEKEETKKLPVSNEPPESSSSSNESEKLVTETVEKSKASPSLNSVAKMVVHKAKSSSNESEEDMSSSSESKFEKSMEKSAEKLPRKSVEKKKFEKKAFVVTRKGEKQASKSKTEKSKKTPTKKMRQLKLPDSSSDSECDIVAPVKRTRAKKVEKVISKPAKPASSVSSFDCEWRVKKVNSKPAPES